MKLLKHKVMEHPFLVRPRPSSPPAPLLNITKGPSIHIICYIYVIISFYLSIDICMLCIVLHLYIFYTDSRNRIDHAALGLFTFIFIAPYRKENYLKLLVFSFG